MKILSCLRVLAFSNNYPLFCFHGKGDFQLAAVVWASGETSMLYNEQMISGEEMHSLITFLVSFMVCNLVDGLLFINH